MSVYKELLYAMREVEEKSVQIYPDAADFGVPVKSKEDPIIGLVKGMSDCYQGETKTEKYGTGATQTVKIDWCDEWRTKKPCWTKFVFVTTRDRKDIIGYLYVETNFK